MGRIDIHNYSQRYKNALYNLENALKLKQISQKNYELIKGFDTAYGRGGEISISRRQRVLQSLVMIVRKYVKKDLDKLDNKEVVKIIDDIEREYPNASIWTLHLYKNVLRGFFKWLEFGEGFLGVHDCPKVMKGIRVGIKKRHIKQVTLDNIFSEDEIRTMIQISEDSRTKAFISMIYELGARIGEIGSLTIGSVHRDDKTGCYHITLDGKTGQRTPFLIFATPYLRDWLEEHPYKDDPAAPLWCKLGRRDKKSFMEYGGLKKIILRAVIKAGIKKHITPHTFRKSRASHLLINKIMNESEVKEYLGWTRDSDVLAVHYSAISMQNANESLMRHHGIIKDETKKKGLKAVECPRCSEINKYDAQTCKKCGMILDPKLATKMSKELEETKEKKNAQDNLLFILAKRELSKLKGKKKEEAQELIETIYRGLKDR